jgi:hypothetical protein
LVVQAAYGPTGVFAGPVTVYGSVPAVRSDYLTQVRRIAPDTLIGREAELREMAEFCTAGQAGSYLWWRAAAAA